MEQRGLVVGLLSDPGVSPDAGSNGPLRDRLRDFTISWLRFKYSGPIIEDSSVDAILARAAARGFRHAFLLESGDILSHAWSLGFVNTIEAWAGERPFFVMGRIEAPAGDGAAHGLSPGGLLVDLERYRAFAAPPFGEPTGALVEVAAPAARGPATGPEPIRELTPGGALVRQRADQPGWNFIHTSLKNGLAVRELPASVQETVASVRPGSAAEATRLAGLLGDGIVEHELDPALFSVGQLRFLQAVQRQVRNSRRGVFVWNFEDYRDVDRPPAGFSPPISTLYSVAAGLKTSWILETHGFDESTRLVYFDYSPEALEFKRLLHEEWDGVDYPEFLRTLFRKLPSERAFYQLWGGHSPEAMDWNVVTAAWEREIERWGGADVIKEHWLRARGMNVEYVLCNALVDRERLLERMADEASPIVWWSNIFFTFFSNWYYTIEQRRAIYEGWIRRLAAQSPHSLVYGNDYNNIPVTGQRISDYARAYFETPEDCLEPRPFPPA